MRIQFVLEIYMYRKKNNDKNKTNVPPPPSTPVTVFLIAENLLTV